MPEIEFGNLDKLLENIYTTKRNLRKIKKKALQEIGEHIHKLLIGRIEDDDGFHDDHERFRTWQQVFIGSKGGYAAVRPTDDEHGKYVGRRSPSAVTGYVERGFSTRGPTGRNKRYEAQINFSRVFGRFFYRDTKDWLEPVMKRAVEKYAQEILDSLEGNG